MPPRHLRAKNFMKNIKATKSLKIDNERKTPSAIKRTILETPLFLCGDVDSSQLYISFWQLMTWKILASQ